MNTEKVRVETDLLGSKEVPAEALYGVQTMRAIENFHISGNLMKDYPNFVLSSGSDTPPHTPEANIDAFFESLTAD